jgi:hypothetical protein
MAIIKVASDCSVLTTQKHALCDIKFFYVDVVTEELDMHMLRGTREKLPYLKSPFHCKPICKMLLKPLP